MAQSPRRQDVYRGTRSGINDPSPTPQHYSMDHGSSGPGPAECELPARNINSAQTDVDDRSDAPVTGQHPGHVETIAAVQTATESLVSGDNVLPDGMQTMPETTKLREQAANHHAELPPSCAYATVKSEPLQTPPPVALPYGAAASSSAAADTLLHTLNTPASEARIAQLERALEEAQRREAATLLEKEQARAAEFEARNAELMARLAASEAALLAERAARATLDQRGSASRDHRQAEQHRQRSRRRSRNSR